MIRYLDWEHPTDIKCGDRNNHQDCILHQLVGGLHLVYRNVLEALTTNFTDCESLISSCLESINICDFLPDVFAKELQE